MKFKLFFMLLSVWVSATAQLKLGNNQNTRNVNSLLEMEHTAKGMLLPRVSLTSTTSYSPLSNTIVAGFVVFNSNASVTAGSSSYPINTGGTGLYYWDGSGWVAVKVADALSKANNLSDLANAATARGNLGVAIGSNVQAWDADLDDLADGTLSASKIGAGLNAASIADGSVSSSEFQSINSVTSNVQTQLDGKQPLNSNLTTLGGLTPTTDNFIYSVAGAWASRTVAQVKSLLAYTKSDISLGNVENTALSTWTGSTALATLGTVTTGTWSANFGAVSGANLTNLTAGNLSGTIPSAVLGNSTHYVGTTALALNRASANQALTGISSITLPGSTSGTVQIIPAATAGTGTVFTLPATTGTAITTGDAGTVTNTMLAGSIANGKLSNSSVTVGSTSISLGSSATTITGLSSVTSTTFVGALTGNASTVTNGVYSSGLSSGYLPRATASNTLGNGIIQDNGSQIGIGIAPQGSWKTYVSGTAYVSGAFQTGSATTLGYDGTNVSLYLTAGTAFRVGGTNNFYFDFGSGGLSGDMIFRGGQYFEERLRLRNQGGMKIPSYASDPSGGSNSEMYYNTTSNKFRGYANGAWVDLH